MTHKDLYLVTNFASLEDFDISQNAFLSVFDATSNLAFFMMVWYYEFVT